MAASVTIKGLPGLNAALARKAAQAHAAAVLAVADETMQVKGDAIQIAPRDTGELEGGITSQAVGTEGEVRATARHSGFVEHGTSSSRAQPFMFPAAERSRARFPTGAAKTIGSALRVGK